MLVIDLDEFNKIKRRLNSIRDINLFNYSRGMLFTILSQKKIDYIKRNYYSSLEKLDEIYRCWKSESRFPRWLRMTPIMKVRLLLKSLEFSKAEINRVLNCPERVNDEKLEDLIWKALYTDYIYSPLAVKHQRARGKLGEEILKQWLNARDIEYKTEEDLRKVFSKTPDFYFENPVKVNGYKVNWIESKALFGDPKTHWFYSKKQFHVYNEMFGEGYIVYWFGHVKNLDGKMIDIDTFNSHLSKALNDMIIYTAGGDSEKVEKISEKLKANIIDAGCDSEQSILKVREFEDIKSTEFLKEICSIVECYSKGRLLIADSEPNWRTSNFRKKIGWIFKNMGFLVVHL